MRMTPGAGLQQFIAVLNLATIMATTSLIWLPAKAQDAASSPPKLDAAQLDQLVARIALYPDPLLAQVLAAASFSEQIPDAYTWAEQHKDVKGDALVQAMESGQLAFDPSVQALIPFVSVLQMMNQDLTWTGQLGTAVLAQRGDVMDAVQRMRKKAYDAGNLKTTEQIKIVQSSPQVIEIQPPSPQIIYVPTYSPQVVYAPAPAPSAASTVAAGLLGFAAGVAITAAFSDGWWGYHGGFVWSSHTVVVHNTAWGRTWANQTTYVHRWGGYNTSFYSRPYAWTNNRVYANRNVNVNRNINVNQNVNLNRNVNRNQNLNVNRNLNANQAVNRNVNANPNFNRGANYGTANRSFNQPANVGQNLDRGYTRNPHSEGAFGGVSQGLSERNAGQRGRLHRR